VRAVFADPGFTVVVQLTADYSDSPLWDLRYKLISLEGHGTEFRSENGKEILKYLSKQSSSL
jgi:hypothetical protein